MSDNVLYVHINNSTLNGFTPIQAASWAWKISEAKAKGVEYVVGVLNGTAICVGKVLAYGIVGTGSETRFCFQLAEAHNSTFITEADKVNMNKIWQQPQAVIGTTKDIKSQNCIFGTV